MSVATIAHYDSSSLPTPPHSPTVYPIRTAIHLLDSLQAFYHRERTWVLHTRAELEENLIGDGDTPLLHDSSSMDSPSGSSAYSSSTDASAASESTQPQQMQSISHVVKAEPVDAELPTKDHSRHHSRWARRKNSYQLKLEGIGHKSRRRFVRPARDHAVSEPGAQLLEMFGDLVDARMESCQRITRLIRSANRADISLR